MKKILFQLAYNPFIQGTMGTQNPGFGYPFRHYWLLYSTYMLHLLKALDCRHSYYILLHFRRSIQYHTVSYFLHWNFDKKICFVVFFHEWNECEKIHYSTLQVKLRYNTYIYFTIGIRFVKIHFPPPTLRLKQPNCV